MEITICKLCRILTIILFSSMIALAKTTQKECVTDDDCSDLGGKYCHEFQCTSCVPCFTFNRQPPTKSVDGIRCAATAESCGPCSPGYQPEEIKGTLRFLMRTYRCEKISGPPIRIEVLFGSLMLVAVAIVLLILFLVWRDSQSKTGPKQVIVDTDSIELVHTSRYFYDNPTSADTEIDGRLTDSPRSEPLSSSGSTVVLHENSDSEKPAASLLSSGIGSYDAHESPANRTEESVRMSSPNLIIVPAEQEGLVQAVPIGPFHIPESDNHTTVGQVLISPSDEMSTENWVWTSVSSSEPEPISPGNVATLIRCLSQENLSQSCPAVKRGNSDPSLSQYANIHVSLNAHRAQTPCSTTSDGMLIYESSAKATYFSSAPNILGDYQPIYPALPNSPVMKSFSQAEAVLPPGDASDIKLTARSCCASPSDDKLEEQSDHVFLSSEDTISQSARIGACFTNQPITNSSNITKSQPLPTTREARGELKKLNSQSLPRLNTVK